MITDRWLNVFFISYQTPSLRILICTDKSRCLGFERRRRCNIWSHRIQHPHKAHRFPQALLWGCKSLSNTLFKWKLHILWKICVGWLQEKIITAGSLNERKIILKYLYSFILVSSEAASLTLKLVDGVVVLSHFHVDEKYFLRDVVWRVIPAVLFKRQGFSSLILSRVRQHRNRRRRTFFRKHFFLQTEYFNADKLYF